MIRVVISLQRDDVAKVATLEMFPLPGERRKETRALADHHVLAALLLRGENLLRAREIVEKRLGADDVFAGCRGGKSGGWQQVWIHRCAITDLFDADVFNIRDAAHLPLENMKFGRTVAPNGTVTPIAGNSTWTGTPAPNDIGDDGDVTGNGQATQAKLFDPNGLAIGIDGALYIADDSGSTSTDTLARIRRVDLATGLGTPDTANLVDNILDIQKAEG